MTDKSLKVLMVDDSENDVLLIIRDLKKGGYNPIYERVDTADAMKQALQKKQWDIILCDYNMPKLNVPSAIALLKETKKDIPILIISGTIGEETAVECMRQGAQDYLMKGKLSRLCPAVARELKEAEFRKQAREQREAALKELSRSEEKYRTILENIEDAYYETDLAGNLTFFNPSMCRIFGYSGDELMGINNRQFTDAENGEKLFQAFHKVYTTGRPTKGFDWQIIRKDGATINIEASVSLLKDSSGKPMGFRGIIRDITERKKSEEKLKESEERYKALFDRSLDMVYILGFDGKLIDANDAALDCFGYKREELPFLDIASFMEKNQIPLVLKLVEEIKEFGIQKNLVELKLRRKDGTYVYVENKGSAIFSNGKPVAIQSIARDITERKKAEESLRKSEELYTKLVDTIPDIVLRTDLDGHILLVNDIGLKISGYSREEVLGRNIITFISSKNHDDVLKNIQEMMGGTLGPREYDLIMKDGTEIPFEVNGDVLRNADGIPFGIVNVCRDIRERKYTERIIRENEERLRGITKNLPGLIFQFYAKKEDQYGLSYISERLKDFFGPEVNIDWENKESLLPLFLSQIHEDDRERLIASMKEAADTKTSWNFEGRLYIMSTGTWIWFQGMATPREEGDIIFFDGLLLDITERKQAETQKQEAVDSLRKSEARLRSINENLPGIIFQFYAKDSGEYGMSYISEPAGELAKIVENVDLKNTDNAFSSLLNYIYDEDKDRLLNSIKTAMETEQPWNFEGRINLLTNKIIWFEGLSTPTRHKDTLYFDGILLNITERKLSEDKFYKVFMTSPDCIAITRMKDGLLIEVNKGFEDVIGLTREQVIGTKSTGPPMNFWPDQSDRDLMVADLNAGRAILHREFLFRRGDGSIRNGIYSARSLIIEDEECLVFIMQDISEHKQKDAELQQTLNSLKKAYDAIVHVMVATIETRDPYTAGHQIRASRIAEAIAREMGLSEDQLAGLRMAGVIHDIGKLSIPSEILSKPTKLTKIEFSLIKQHPKVGYDLLKNLESPWPLAEIIYQHHERIDGSGYPRNLKGDEILIEARILAVSDVVESMASHRPYRPSLGLESALEEITKNRGILYDNAVVDACLRLFNQSGYQIPDSENKIL